MMRPSRTVRLARALTAASVALLALPLVWAQEYPGSPWRGSAQPAEQPDSIYAPGQPGFAPAAQPGQAQPAADAPRAGQGPPRAGQWIGPGGTSAYGAAQGNAAGPYGPSAYGAAGNSAAGQPAFGPGQSGFGPGQGPGGQAVRSAQQMEEMNLTGRPAYEYIPPARPGDHPLVQAVEWAKVGLRRIELIEDYSATVAKRERINGTLRDYEYFFVKIRHKPFSVYLYFLSPPNLRGQEVIYVEGQNNGNMWAHTVGIRGSLIGTISLAPTGMIAMKDQRYPMTEIGIKNLTRRLIEVGEQDMKYGECEVRFFRGAKVNDRTCTCLQVVHPVPRRNFLFHIARIFVDDELNIPIRYEAHSWPTEPGGPPLLLEEYTYLDIKLNNGFTDLDFDPKNPNYGFP